MGLAVSTTAEKPLIFRASRVEMEDWQDHETLLHLVDGVVFVGDELGGIKERLDHGTEWMREHEELHKKLILPENDEHKGSGILKSIATIVASVAVIVVALLTST